MDAKFCFGLLHREGAFDADLSAIVEKYSEAIEDSNCWTRINVDAWPGLAQAAINAGVTTYPTAVIIEDLNFDTDSGIVRASLPGPFTEPEYVDWINSLTGNTAGGTGGDGPGSPTTPGDGQLPGGTSSLPGAGLFNFPNLLPLLLIGLILVGISKRKK